MAVDRDGCVVSSVSLVDEDNPLEVDPEDSVDVDAVVGCSGVGDELVPSLSKSATEVKAGCVGSGEGRWV